MQIENLVRMADQIARNNRALPPDKTIEKVAGHIQDFWTPTMRRDIEAFAAFSPDELDPTVVAALDLLRQRSQA